jgi:large subunit ribosomal protein L25
VEQVTLNAEPRTELGSRASRRRRRTGSVPAVLYGRGLDPMSVAVNDRDLYAALHTEAGANALINLEVKGTKQPFLTVAREIQRHPVRGEIAHLDFISISLDEEIEADVGLEFLGIPVGVSEGEGIVETIRNAVSISALPTAIPSSISISIADLEVGDGIQVKDLPAIDGVEYLDDPETDLLTVVIPRIVEVEEPEEEVEILYDEEGRPIEPVEGEEEAEGAAPGEEGAASPEASSEETEEGA